MRPFFDTCAIVESEGACIHDRNDARDDIAAPILYGTLAAHEPFVLMTEGDTTLYGGTY
ncbi:MAG: hypothetical protein IT509_13170 [Rhodocyclaceae bacterium]|nr:hypothetical protein [Rhodocyclaceae bacterium]